MRGNNGVTAKRGGHGKTSLARLDATTDADIARQISQDPDVAPEWTDAMFAAATWIPPEKKVAIALRVSPDVLKFFRKAGPGYQSRINAVLEAFVRQARTLSADTHELVGKRGHARQKAARKRATIGE